MDMIFGKAEAFVSLYESRHPRDKAAFARFFRRTNPRFFLHIVCIKSMVYALDEAILGKMLALMRPWRGIYIELFSEKNPKKHGASAYFGRDFWGRARIRYYEIEKKQQLNPPYKTFFHEFGHALDDLSQRGRRFCSDRFRCTQEAEKYCLNCTKDGIYLEKRKVVETKTIHEWAVFDVENYLVRTAFRLFQGEAEPEVQCRMIHFVVYDLFLCPDGEEKLEKINAGVKPEKMNAAAEFKQMIGGAENGKIKEIKGLAEDYVGQIRVLYRELQKETEQKTLRNVRDTIVLAKDLFGGITNNQLGGGHGKEYWFTKKRRIREVSREAFAGYFEYRVTIADPVLQEMVINPYQCIPYTKAALEQMLEKIVRKK